jgi:cbb3-type cytochrome oxidase cytochrome c subunit
LASVLIQGRVTTHQKGTTTMGDTPTKAAPHKAATRATPGKDAPKRKVLTPAEKVAKAEADLKAAREAAEKAERAKQDKARERRASLVKRVEPLIAQLNEVNSELDYPRVELTPVAAEPAKG